MRATLRPYQQKALDDVRSAFASGKRAPLLCSPTGSGKTVMFASITEGAARKGKRVLILVHRREILLQCSRALDALGEQHGLIAPGIKQTTDAVQVASVQTLVRRLGSIAPPDLIVIDECHHATASGWSKVLAAFPRARVLGVTATACRTDGAGLGNVFDSLILGPSVRELIEDGYLSRPVVYAPPLKVDISAIKHRMGEFDAASTVAALDKASITGDVIAHYRKLCAGKPAIAFCATVAHAHHVAEAFNAAGYKAAALDGATEDEPRRQMIADLGNGNLNVLTSCDVVSEGTDIPAVFSAILLRPTESTGLYLQQVGRVLRSYPGKTHSVILDHVGNSMRHGFADDDRTWSLDAAKRSKKKDDGDKVQRMKLCSHCYAMCPNYMQKCEQCGTAFEVGKLAPKQVDGELKEVTDEQKELMRLARKNEVRGARDRASLELIAQQRGYKKGWIDFTLKAREQSRNKNKFRMEL